MPYKEVLETYRCLISCRKNLPGASLEDVFSDLKPLETEYEWLKQKAEECTTQQNPTAEESKS